MISRLFASLLLAAGVAAPLAAAEYLIDRGDDVRNWSFFNGAEFKGAKGGIAAADGGRLALSYDFTGGGAYVGTYSRAALPEAEEYRVTVKAEEDAVMNYRLRDANGRWFQARGFRLAAGQETMLTLSTQGPWQSAWGGREKEGIKNFTPPAKALWLTVTKPKDAPLAGRILIWDLKAVREGASKNAITGENTSLQALGWQVRAEYQPQLTGALLLLTCTPHDARPIQFEAVLPAAGRDDITRFQLDPAKGLQVFSYRVPFSGAPNPRNVYAVKVRLVDGERIAAESVAPIRGNLNSGINLGAPRRSTEIASSRMGTCVHFSYAPRPEGGFKGWHPVDMLLEQIADCGFKYIREGVRLEKAPDGSLKVSERDVNTLQKAKDLGIEQIVVIDMKADESTEYLLSKVTAIVRDTREFVRVYELGNEPQNFGNWRKKFGGTWNGVEKDGSVSPWVKAHTAATNAAADHLKKLCPEATVIGLGSCTPTNFHALNLGVTANLDGVVDHPYTYSLPSEKIPYGHNLNKRDGIEVGDAEHTFAGMVQSYHKHFQKTGKPRSLWLTEFGFSTFWFDGTKEKGLYAGFTEEAQSAYLIRRFIESMALPVAVACQYDFLDDYASKPYTDEANFGLLRGDYSRKPAFYAVQRFNSLFSGAEPDASAQANITDAPLHRSMRRGSLTKWDDASIDASNGVRTYTFANPATPSERMLAVWSMQPYSREFNNRSISLEITGWSDCTAAPVGINLLTGDTFDLPVRFADGKIIVEKLPLKDAPLLIKFFRP